MIEKATRRRAGVVAALLLIIFVSRSFAEQKAPAVYLTAYYSCMDREAETAVKSALQKGATFLDVDHDLDRIGDQVFKTCTSRYTNGMPLQSRDRESAKLRATDTLTALMHADYEKRMAERREKTEREAARNASVLKAEDAAATRSYGDCLFASAQSIAIISAEPAEVVTKAAFAACRDKREAILEVHRRYKDTLFTNEVLEAADQKLVGPLILEIIKARSARPSAPPPKALDKAI